MVVIYHSHYIFLLVCHVLNVSIHTYLNLDMILNYIIILKQKFCVMSFLLIIERSFKRVFKFVKSFERYNTYIYILRFIYIFFFNFFEREFIALAINLLLKKLGARKKIFDFLPSSIFLSCEQSE